MRSRSTRTRSHSLLLAALLAAGAALTACASSSERGENEAMCKEVKPGEVTTVNHYCVIVPEDPVDPSIVREYKGQRIGLCCKGCIKRWEAMSDADKDAAIAFAVAKGKP